MTRIVILITSLLALSSLALLAQPADFERGRGSGQMSFKNTETIEKVGLIQGVVTETPEQPGMMRNESNDTRRGGSGRGQFQPEEHMFVKLYSGESVDIGTESYWKSKKLNLETNKAIKFQVIQRGESEDYMAVNMEYENVEYKLLDDNGRPVWMKAMSGMGGRGDGPPSRRN